MGIKPETIELCRVTIGDQVKLATAVTRAGSFNRHAGIEAHVSIVEARWSAIESVLWQEIARLQQKEAGQDPATALMAALLAAQQTLERCRDQFVFYAGSHRAKGTAEAEEKAKRNDEFASACNDTLASITEIMEGHGG